MRAPPRGKSWVAGTSGGGPAESQRCIPSPNASGTLRTQVFYCCCYVSLGSSFCVGVHGRRPLKDRFSQLRPMPERVDGIVLLGGAIDRNESDDRGIRSIRDDFDRDYHLPFARNENGKFERLRGRTRRRKCSSVKTSWRAWRQSRCS
jgi:hypothetical protein